MPLSLSAQVLHPLYRVHQQTEHLLHTWHCSRRRGYMVMIEQGLSRGIYILMGGARQKIKQDHFQWFKVLKNKKRAVRQKVDERCLF